MKHSLKISLMALAAMFAFSTVADAQFGGLLKKAKAAVGGNEASKNQKEIEGLISKCKAQIPQKGQTPNAVFSWDGAEVASWDGSKNELTIKTDKGGNKPGTVLTVNPSTGKVTDASGKDMGSISETAIMSPNFGELQLKPKEGVYTLACNPQIETVKRLTSYRVIMTSRKEEMFNTKYLLGITTDQKQGKGYTYFVNCAKEVEYTFAKHKCVVSDQMVGAALPIYVASLMMTQQEYLDAMIKNTLGYDPNRKYTTKELNDLIRWKDAETEAMIKKIEEGELYSDSRVKGAKIAAIGLMSKWDRTVITENHAKWNEYTYNRDEIEYWVVYELPDGKNKVGMYPIIKNFGNRGETKRGKCTGFNEITDWKRK